MFLFDGSVVDVKKSQLVPKIKRQVVNEVAKEIIVVWKKLNLPVQLEKNVCQKVVKIVEDLDEIKKRNKSRSDSEIR